MPTRGRIAYAAQAVACFLEQDYPDRELVILDDFDCKSFPNGIEHPLIRYHCLGYLVGTGINIPMKRNRVNALADSPVLAHWDSDDYSAPQRLTQQMELLESSGKSCVGFHSMIFYDETTRKAARYETPIKQPPNFYALGTSLLYKREFWESNRYREHIAIGSDNDFVKRARDQKQLVSVDAGTLMIARSHPGNTGAKNIAGSNYVSVSLDLIPKAFYS